MSRDWSYFKKLRTEKKEQLEKSKVRFEQSRSPLPALATLSDLRLKRESLKLKLSSLELKSDTLSAELVSLENELSELEQPWMDAWQTLRDSKEALEAAKMKNSQSIATLAGLKRRAQSCLEL